jgi:hypothetical protein
MLTRRSTLHARYQRVALLAMLAVLSVAAAGCGSDDEARSQERPPVPINVSLLIGQDKITASPAEFGAGPVTLLIANQSGAAQTLTVDGPRLTRTAGPIPPGDTATLKVTLGTGEFTVSPEESASLDPATLTVGPPRDSAQNELLLP